VHFDIYRVHSPTNALFFIILEKALKYTLKFTLTLLLHVSVYDHHQVAYVGAWLNLYFVKIQYKLHRYTLCGGVAVHAATPPHSV
jgi:hypothetical protein